MRATSLFLLFAVCCSSSSSVIVRRVPDAGDDIADAGPFCISYERDSGACTPEPVGWTCSYDAPTETCGCCNFVVDAGP
jgi:hypothetical protein